MVIRALEHDFFDFPFSWEFHPPNRRTLTHIFQRVGIPPTTYIPYIFI